MSTQQRSHLIGTDQEVPLVTGRMRRYVNLDYAASTPSLAIVAHAVEAFLPWYSSVHRGAGFKSQVSTAAYEGARGSVRSFVHARDDDAVIFTRNTTDAVNLLASSLPEQTQVLAFATEHHATLLPWRRGAAVIRYLPGPDSPADVLLLLETALRKVSSPHCLVAVTGASNVTGEVWPIGEIAALAHRYDARLLVDAAQLAPHMPIDMQGSAVDYLVMSGHKLYAPFGAGALIGRADWLRGAPPFLFGGGAVDFVTLDDVLWTDLPDRQEAGSPNVIGVITLGLACQTLGGIGMDCVAAEESELVAYARSTLSALPGVTIYNLWPDADVPRLGIISFNLAGFWHSHLAAILSAEYGIGVRHGCFCAHPLMQKLIRIDDTGATAIREAIATGHKERIPGAVRISLGLDTRREDIDYVAHALDSIARNGPMWGYRVLEASGEYVPNPETRSRPEFPFPLVYPHE